MIDWLRPELHDPVVEVGGQALPLAIKRHPTARRMTLRLAPDGREVRVTIPKWGRTREALEFARSRAEWLEAQLGKVEQPKAPIPGSILPFRGEELAVDWQQDHPRRVQREGGRLLVGGPLEALPARLERWLKAEARELMAADLAEYCRRANVPTPNIALSGAQRRWGSCSTSGTVRINWRLVMAPDAVRRSVVAHEVAHLVHFDHSPAFHALLGDLFEGDLKGADRWLKRQGRSLYRHFG
ncbi:MAG: SprT family zinc-dependent metalloprotease [Altererythrobacter sp.]